MHKITVCMATYNGEKYIGQQIESILTQLEIDDELVIIDDVSSDGTAVYVKNICDKRIRLVENKMNIGITASFEKALILSKGNIIFLCDQDDIWFDNKIEKIKGVFNEDSVDIVQHDAVIVNNDMEIIRSSFKDLRNAGPGVIKNIISNTYLGCGMALRRSVIDKCLPIPKQKGYHDRWIGIVSEIQGCKAVFIDEPLMYYVRHEGTGSNLKRRNLWVIIVDRINLIKSIICFFIKKFFFRRKATL